MADSEEFMAQKFTSLEDAANQLGISRDRLNQLREAGKVRAYRDGASWKFRSDDIDKLATTGIPQIDPSSSDLALESADESASSGLDLDMADEAPAGPVSDINLEEVDEPTVAGVEEDESDALAIDLDEDSISLSDSILLSEAELGTSPGRPPSTIIGRGELDLDADLDLSPAEKSRGAASDVTMASESDLGLDLPSPSGDFAGLEEVEVDLEAESSRILSPEETAKARGAAAAAKAGESSDLELAPTDSDLGRATSDIGLGGDAASGAGLTGLSALELEDDEVLGDGSDVTLSGESSGINIISPSDSGLALDEVALDLSGSSPIASSLELGDSETSDVGLEPLGSEIGAGSKVGEDFQLTPLGEEGADDEKDSSQVIALDELSEEAGAPLGAPVSESGMLAEDFGVGLTPGAVVVSDATAETPFSMWNVMGLASCMLLLGLCSMMMFDLLRNMWSWDGVAPLNSSLLEVVNPFL
jgi:excisionase family DNA binding protein